LSDAPRVFCYGACSTCRRALAWLSGRGIVPETIEITKTPPSLELLVQALNQLGDRRRLFNTSGKSYRELASERVKAIKNITYPNCKREGVRASRKRSNQMACARLV